MFGIRFSVVFFFLVTVGFCYSGKAQIAVDSVRFKAFDSVRRANQMANPQMRMEVDSINRAKSATDPNFFRPYDPSVKKARPKAMDSSTTFRPGDSAAEAKR